jgi:DNA-binding IclR family transcriptional regulator
VPRAALSASRSIDVIEFLALFPQQRFSLSQIAEATQINISSLHAVLKRMSERGYLLRCPDKKTYGLGPSLIAVGQAGLESLPSVARAKQASEDLLRELGIPVLLSSTIGDDILAVIALKDASGRSPGMHSGERLPLVAPIGAPFLAWSSEAAIDAWITRRTSQPAPEIVEAWRRDLELTRQRGYQVILRSANVPTIASLMAEMATSRRSTDYRNELTKLINSIDHHRPQPETIVSDVSYDVMLICAPLFDQNGEVAFNLCLGGFRQSLTGTELTHYADRLMRACLEIMRVDRNFKSQGVRTTKINTQQDA